MPYNKSILAQLNKKIVLEMIREKGPINKAEIARRAELSIPTVMKITEEFERQKLIRNVGKGESTGGKRPDLFEIVPDAFHVMGIDIGRHYVKMVIMDIEAQILRSDSFPVSDDQVQQPEEFLNFIGDKALHLISDCKEKMKYFMGIGVGMPGILDYETGKVLFSPDFNWIDVPLLEILKKKLNYEVMLENANRVLALGEYTYGAARNSEYLFCINLGYGIGAAIIDKGELVQGKSGTSGEFGHVIMIPDGPVCACGNRGCLEAISSGNAIAKRMEEELKQGKQSSVLNKRKENGKLEAKDIFEAAREGDVLGESIIRNAIKYLGIAIASCINLLDPGTIVLAGGLTKSQDLFMEDLLETVNRYKMKYSGRNVRISIGKQGEFGTAIGAAALLIRQFMDNGGQL